MSLKKLGAALVLLLLMVVASPLSASATPIVFNCITNNSGSCGSFAGTFTGNVTVVGNQMTVQFLNGGVGDGVIAEIYTDAPGTGTGFALTGILENPPSVDFSFGGSPPQLPSQNTAIPPFNSDANLFATANSPSPTHGVGAGEQVSLVFTLSPILTQAQIDALLASGDLRFGIHVQSLGTGENSESFVSGGPGLTAVPEPASMLLLGTGLLAVARARRRKKS